MVRKAKWKLLELPLPGKIVSPKQYCVPKMYKINATIRALKGVPNTSPFNSPIWPVEKTDGSWRMTVNDHNKLTAVTAQDVDGGQINTSPSTWYLATDVVNGFFLYTCS